MQPATISKVPSHVALHHHVKTLALERVLPNGARANLFGQRGHQCVGPRPLATYRDISNKCWAAGYHFSPDVHEIQGGMAKGADAAMRAICGAVGKRESMDAATVRVEFVVRLRAVITRTATRGVQKRLAKQRHGITSDLPTLIVRQVLTAAELEMNEEGELGVEVL